MRELVSVKLAVGKLGTNLFTYEKEMSRFGDITVVCKCFKAKRNDVAFLFNYMI